MSAVRRARKRKKAQAVRNLFPFSSAYFRRCPNCGGQGPHFVPPSLGDPGFYACVQLPSDTECEVSANDD